MLNRNSLFVQIKKISENLFIDTRNESDIAQQKWIEISNDHEFNKIVELSNSSFLIPTWYGSLSDVYDVNHRCNDYSVLSVDGSQVYPDRNVSGASCFLINIGSCLIKYNDNSSVKLCSEPTVFLSQKLVKDNEKISFTRDLVDLKREELELERLLNIALVENVDISFVDGTIIFWPLEGKTKEVKNMFLSKYLYYLNKFYEEKKLIAGFISFPKSRELVNLVKLGLCRFDFAECISCHRIYNNFPCKVVDNLIDTSIAKSFLKVNQRTTVFFSKSEIVENYPDHLKPCFFYLNTGKEIIRIETFAWIAQDIDKLDFISEVAINQVKKGMGYPVVLSEAHEQAVVKGPDREFFYQLLQREALEQNKRLFYSEKSLKKRGIAI